MTAAADLVTRIRRDLAPAEPANRLVPLIERGVAPRSAVAALAAEEWHIVPSDRRSFLLLAARSDTGAAVDFFTTLAQGEGLAAAKLPALAAASGLDSAGLAAYEPMAGCQAYPSYVARLALGADPAAVILAILANFAAWGRYCAALADALRREYAYDDEACGFLDFFATPVPELEQQAIDVVQAALDQGDRLDRAWRYGRLLQGYELMFWNTLADAGSNSPR
jgi:hypothetical protein